MAGENNARPGENIPAYLPSACADAPGAPVGIDDQHAQALAGMLLERAADGLRGGVRGAHRDPCEEDEGENGGFHSPYRQENRLFHCIRLISGCTFFTQGRRETRLSQACWATTMKLTGLPWTTSVESVPSPAPSQTTSPV